MSAPASKGGLVRDDALLTESSRPQFVGGTHVLLKRFHVLIRRRWPSLGSSSASLSRAQLPRYLDLPAPSSNALLSHVCSLQVAWHEKPHDVMAMSSSQAQNLDAETNRGRGKCDSWHWTVGIYLTGLESEAAQVR